MALRLRIQGSLRLLNFFYLFLLMIIYCGSPEVLDDQIESGGVRSDCFSGFPSDNCTNANEIQSPKYVNDSNTATTEPQETRCLTKTTESINGRTSEFIAAEATTNGDEDEHIDLVTHSASRSNGLNRNAFLFQNLNPRDGSEGETQTELPSEKRSHSPFKDHDQHNANTFGESELSSEKDSLDSMDNKTLNTRNAVLNGPCMPGVGGGNPGEYQHYPNKKPIRACTFYATFVRIPCNEGFHSCKDKCGEFLHNNTCSCHERCTIYKSCCDTFHTECTTRHGFLVYPGPIEGEFSKSIKCDRFTSVKVISKCPSRRSNYNVEALYNALACESQSQPSSILELSPVTDSYSGHHFKNLACWKCWEEMKGNALFWSVRFIFERRLKPVEEHNVTAFIEAIVDNPGRALWSPPGGHDVHRCHSCAGTFCTECVNSQLESKCNQYAHPVKVANAIYKNINCFRCSNEKKYSIFELSKTCGAAPPPVIPEDSIDENERFVVIINVSSKLELVMRQKPSLSPHKFVWETLKCRGEKSEGPFICTATKCNPQSTLENGRCKYPVFFEGSVTICAQDGDVQGKCKKAQEVLNAARQTLGLGTLMTNIIRYLKSEVRKELDAKLDIHRLEKQISFSARKHFFNDNPDDNMTASDFWCTGLFHGWVRNVLEASRIGEKIEVCVTCRLVVNAHTHTPPCRLYEPLPDALSQAFRLLGEVMGLSTVSIMITSAITVLGWFVEHV